VKTSKIDDSKKVNSITREEKERLVDVFKNLEFTLDSLESVAVGIVTSGGVNVKEVNPKTMQSKLVEGLYFAGEVLDVDAYTGGFNLQIAFSTGYTAGINI
jgi:predicted flavoprotein YhiN